MPPISHRFMTDVDAAFVQDIELLNKGLAGVRRQSFSESWGCFVTEALVRFPFEFRQPRLGAATGVF